MRLHGRGLLTERRRCVRGLLEHARGAADREYRAGEARMRIRQRMFLWSNARHRGAKAGCVTLLLLAAGNNEDRVTKTVDVGEVEPSLSDLLCLTREGVEVLLVVNNTPLARVVPTTPEVPMRVAGLHPGAIRTSDDFNAPLPDDFWLGAV